MVAKILASLLIVYVASITCRGIYLYRERKEYLGYCVRKKGKVFYSEGMLAAGILLSAVFALITFVFAFTDGNTFMTALFAFTSLTCSFLIISFCNCYIIYDDEKIMQSTFMGIKREYKYEEVTVIEFHGRDVHISADKKKICVYADYTIGTKSDFIETVKKRYRAIHGSNIPQKAGFDLFRGNITNGNERFVSICIISISLAVMSAICGIGALTAKLTEADTEFFEISLYYPEKVGDTIVFTSGLMDEYFKLSATLPEEEYTELITLCEDGAVFSVRAERSGGGKYGEPYYRIVELAHGEKVFYTLAQANEAEVSEDIKLCIFFAVPLIPIWALTALQIYAAWHPEKFSKKFRRLLFPKKRR